MAKVLVCLLSDQAIPNLASIIHYNPDKIVFLVSNRAEKEQFDTKILNSLAVRNIVFSNADLFKISVHNENSILDVQNALAKINEFVNLTDELIVNITGGNKPMSIAAYNYFSVKNASIIYINNNNFINSKTDLSEQFRPQKPIDCQEYFLAYGFKYKCVDSSNLEDPKDIQKANSTVIEIARHFEHDDLIVFPGNETETKKRWDKFRDKGGKINEDFQWNTNLDKEIVKTLEKCSDNGFFSSFWADLLTGGWLELFIKNLLTRHQNELKIHDVQKRIETSKGLGIVPNELDVVFMKGTTLNIVECKTGKQEQGAPVDVFYKLEAIKKQFGALQINSFLVTASGSILNKDNSIKPNIQDRAELYKCKILLPDLIRQLASANDQEEIQLEILKSII